MNIFESGLPAAENFFILIEQEMTIDCAGFATARTNRSKLITDISIGFCAILNVINEFRNGALAC